MNKPHTHTPQLYTVYKTTHLQNHREGLPHGRCLPRTRTDTSHGRADEIYWLTPPSLSHNTLLLFSRRGIVTEMVEANQERIKARIQTHLWKSLLPWTGLRWEVREALEYSVFSTAPLGTGGWGPSHHPTHTGNSIHWGQVSSSRSPHSVGERGRD